MNMQTGIIGLIVLVVLVGGAYFLLGQNTEDTMKDGTGVMQNDVMQKDGTTGSEDEVMSAEGGSASLGMEKEGTVMAQGGTYEAYAPEKVARAGSGDVVLFFRASWCPTCKVIDTDIRSNFSAIPKNVTILDVNYDSETALRQKYGVTYQHTFVQVDASGQQIAKWSGSPTLAALLANVK